MVLMRSPSFHTQGLDLHVRTTIDSYYSYIESAAVKIGNHILEVVSKDKIILDGVEMDAPTSGSIPIPNDVDGETYLYESMLLSNKKAIYRLHMGSAEIHFKFFAHFLTINVMGGKGDFGDSVGLMGNHTDGSMWDREGKAFQGTFEDYGFEWQVNPLAGDAQLFHDKDRSPQLPYEKCRVPTAARPSRRKLRGNDANLFEKAQAACQAVANQGDVDLCIDDVLTTGELGLAEVW